MLLRKFRISNVKVTKPTCRDCWSSVGDVSPTNTAFNAHNGNILFVESY